jgi:hypothetical protein
MQRQEEVRKAEAKRAAEEVYTFASSTEFEGMHVMSELTSLFCLCNFLRCSDKKRFAKDRFDFPSFFAWPYVCVAHAHSDHWREIVSSTWISRKCS